MDADRCGLAVGPDGSILVVGTAKVADEEDEYQFALVRFTSDGGDLMTLVNPAAPR